MKQSSKKSKYDEGAGIDSLNWKLYRRDEVSNETNLTGKKKASKYDTEIKRDLDGRKDDFVFFHKNRRGGYFLYC